MIVTQDLNAIVDQLVSAIVTRVVGDVKRKLSDELTELTFSMTQAALASVNTNLQKEVITPPPAIKQINNKQVKETAKQADKKPPQTAIVKVTLPQDKQLIKGVPSDDEADTRILIEYEDRLSKITESNVKEFNNLPPYLRDTLVGFPKFDLAGLWFVLSTVPEIKWESLLNGTAEAECRALIEATLEGKSEFAISKGSTFLQRVFARVAKLSKKKEREFLLRQANLKRLEDQKAKKEAAIKKKQGEIATEVARHEAQLAVIIPPPVPFKIYAPRIDKEHRSKVGIVGLLPEHQQMMKTEFGRTFILSMADNDEGLSRVKAINESSDAVFVLKKFVSHAHTSNVEKAKLHLVDGAMTSIREHLSKYARETYKKPLTN